MNPSDDETVNSPSTDASKILHKDDYEAKSPSSSRETVAPKSLAIRDRYLALIREGKKSSTIRLGQLNIEPNTKLSLRSQFTEIAVLVQSVEYKHLSELTEDDGKKDGFESLGELLTELQEIYPSIKSDDILTIVSFSTDPHSSVLNHEQLRQENMTEAVRLGILTKAERDMLLDRGMSDVQRRVLAHRVREKLSSLVYEIPLLYPKFESQLKGVFTSLVNAGINAVNTGVNVAVGAKLETSHLKAPAPRLREGSRTSLTPRRRTVSLLGSE